MISRSDKFTALKEAFYRPTAPNITSLFATAPELFTLRASFKALLEMT